jgi:hypothetical protein
MQIRRSSYPADDLVPPCVFHHDERLPCLHRHGCYWRFAGPDGSEIIRIIRFLCKFTGKTISVLPDHLLPYRAVHVPSVEQDFDHRAGPQDSSGSSPAEHSELTKSCLRRAWRRFADQSRRQSLTEFFGQRIALTDTAEQLWETIRHAAGELPKILLELAREGKSLLGDYRCLSRT